MTTQLDQAEAGRTTRAVWVALASPMVAGLVWAVLMYFWWRMEAAQPYNELASVFALWFLLMLGVAGLIGLSVPLVIGLMARTQRTRLAAAMASATIAAFGGAFSFISAAGSGRGGSQAMLQYGAAVALFLPIVVLAFAVRRPSA